MAKKEAMEQIFAGNAQDLSFRDSSVEMGSREYKQLPADKIKSSPFNNGMPMDNDVIASYAGSMSESGLLQPITVYDLGDGTYEILSGHQRFAAWCDVLGHDTIPAVIKPMEKDITKRFMAHTQANTQSREHDGRFWCCVLANARKVLSQTHPNISKAEEIDMISDMLSISRSQIYRYDNFAKLDPSLQMLEAKGVLSVRKALLAVDADLTDEQQQSLAGMIEGFVSAEHEKGREDCEPTAQDVQAFINTIKGSGKKPASRARLTYAQQSANTVNGCIKFFKKAKTESEKAAAIDAINDLQQKLEVLKLSLGEE